MYEVRTTAAFGEWLDARLDARLDHPASNTVLARIANMAEGNFGDCKSLGGCLFESGIHSGPGYRLYFTREGSTVVVVLLGGDKSTQSRDILRARALAAAVRLHKEDA